MAYIEISELTETLQVDNDSVFPVVYQGATRKIKFSSFKQMLNYFTAVSYNKTTGVFTFTKVDGTSATLTSDLQLSFKDVSFDSSTGTITFTKQSGETKTLNCDGKRFITANEINKLSGIEAGAQVNVIETVKVNGEALTPDANKAVDIDTSDYIKNTDFATTEKAGIIKVGNSYGSDILNGALRANEYSYEAYPNVNRNAFISKGTLENVINGKQLINQSTLNESQEGQDVIIEDLKTKNEMLINDHVPITAKNTEIQLNGTGDLPMELVPYGNITQETTTGKNLLDYITNLKTSFDGLESVINSDGSITTTGIPTSDYRSIIVYNIDDILESGQTYMLSQKDSQDNILFLQINARNKTTGVITYYSLYNKNEISFTADTDTYTYVINLQTSTVANCGSSSRTITNYYMLEKGSTATTFEKYTGGQASPNPSYPSPVKVVDGSYEVEVENKNLFDKNDVTDGYYYNALGQLSTSTNWKVAQIKINPNSNYYLSGNNYNNTTAYIVLLDENKNFISSVSAYKLTTSISTFNATYIGLSIADYNGTGDLNTLQLEKGSTATSYVAHQEQIKTIDTSPNPLYSENDCYKYLTLEQATALGLNTGEGWYVYNEWGKVVLNGNENWTKSDVTTVDRFVFNNSNYLSSISSLCNYFKTGHTNNTNIGQWFNNMGVQFVFNLSEFGTTTLEQWKTWLSTHNLVLLQPLANPTYTKITDTDLINSLEALKDMQSYYDVTNISQTHSDEQADMIINAKALKSLKAMQDEIDNIESRLSLIE